MPEGQGDSQAKGILKQAGQTAPSQSWELLRQLPGNGGKEDLTAYLKAWAHHKIGGVSGELETPAGGCGPGGFGGSRLWFKNEGECLTPETLLKSGPTETWSLASLFKTVQSSQQDSMQSQVSCVPGCQSFQAIPISCLPAFRAGSRTGCQRSFFWDKTSVPYCGSPVLKSS